MAERVYKVFLAKPLEAYYKLSDDEKASLMAKVTGALEEVGGKRIVLCNSSWAAEQWRYFGVEEFPSIEATQQHAKLLNELDWGRYTESLTTIGTEWQTPEST